MSVYIKIGIYSELYSCETPVALVEVGPHCITVFSACIEGVCACTYTLCGAVCQLKPCRFAAAILGFGTDVSTDDMYVLTGAYRSVRIVDHGCPSSYCCVNYASIVGEDFVDEMTCKVKEEISESKVRPVASRPRCVHSLCGITKSNGALRPITDCSMPEDSCINLYMDTTCEKFHYKSVDHVVDLMNRDDWGAVSDISSAYRTIHIIPSHRTYQGFQWDIGDGVNFYKDLRLCFGLKCVPYAFTKFSDFLVKCCYKQGADRIVNYLDDFGILGDSSSSCQDSQDILYRMFLNFGFKVAEAKSTTPCKQFKFLGILIDTDSFTISIDEDKLARVKREVSLLLDKDKCKRIHLEEVAGLLAHCATVIKGGRTFARRIYNVL